MDAQDLLFLKSPWLRNTCAWLCAAAKTVRTSGESFWVPPEWSELIVVKPVGIVKMASENRRNLRQASVSRWPMMRHSCLSLGKVAAWKGGEP